MSLTVALQSMPEPAATILVIMAFIAVFVMMMRGFIRKWASTQGPGVRKWTSFLVGMFLLLLVLGILVLVRMVANGGAR